MRGGKRWCFTLNNYNGSDLDNCRQFIEINCRYGIVGEEVGESGTPHLQGFINCRESYDLASLKIKLGSKFHFERARGTDSENRRYCSKDGQYWESGSCDRTENGSNTLNLGEAFIRHMDERKPLRGFMESYPSLWLKHGSTMLRNYFMCKPLIQRPSVGCMWIWGCPGTGKSKQAHTTFPDAYIKDGRSIWWNGYNLETEVIIDDLAPKSIDINHLLRWFDRYKCYIQTKGGMMPLYATTFVVTSNFPPEDCYKCDDGRDHPQIDALLRRISVKHKV